MGDNRRYSKDSRDILVLLKSTKSLAIRNWFSGRLMILVLSNKEEELTV